MGRVLRWGVFALVWAQLGLAAPGEGPSTPVDDPGSERDGAEVAEKYRLDLPRDERLRLADEKGDEAVEQLEALIPGFREDDPEKPDLYFQLAELLWGKARYLYHVEEQRFEAAYRAYEKRRETGRAGPEPKRDHSASAAHQTRALEIFERVVERYPDYPKSDEAHFAYAYSLEELGRQGEAVAIYEQLIGRFPESRFVPDSQVQLGDHYFENNDLVRARASFAAAVEGATGRVRSYALYKLAWCDFNAGDYGQSLARLQKVVDMAEEGGKPLAALRSEALRDTVRVFVHLGQPVEARAYLREEASGERRVRLYEGLGHMLADAGDHPEAIKTFQTILKEHPDHPEAPGFQQAVVNSYEQLRDRGHVQKEVERLVSTYGPKSAWWKENRSEKQRLEKTLDTVEPALRAIVTDYHNEAQKTQRVETFRLARDVYARYLEAFGASDDPDLISDFAFNMRYYYAEVLWTLEEWDEAARQYDAVAVFEIPERDTAREVSNEEYRELAAYNAILAYNKLLKIERGELAESKLVGSDRVGTHQADIEKREDVELRQVDAAAEPLTDIEGRLVAAADVYRERFPKGKDAVDIQYQAALIHYDKNHFDEAIERFLTLAKERPTEQLARDAADLVMYVYEQRGEWQRLNETARAFLAEPKLAKPGTGFAQRVERVVTGSQYKFIDEVMYKKGRDPGRAADAFIAFVEEYPEAETADRALAYASLLYREAGRLDRALEAGQRLLESHPRSPLVLKGRYSLARLYEETAQYERAADAYARFVEEFEDRAKAVTRAADARAAKRAEGVGAKGVSDNRGEDVAALIEEARAWLPDATFNAAVWLQALGREVEAAEGFARYVARYEDREDVPAVRLRIARLFKEAEEWKKTLWAVGVFEKHHRRDPRANDAQRFEIVAIEREARLALGHENTARKLVGKMRGAWGRLAEDEKSGLIRRAYASALFDEMEPHLERYREVRFQNVRTVQRDLATKRKRLQGLEAGYGEVLDTGAGSLGIAAMVRLADAYGDLAKNILDSPTPPGLDEEQQALYQQKLDELGLPLEDKAAEMAELALSKALELDLYDEWTLKAQETLERYRPGTFGEPREVAYLDGAALALSLPGDAGVRGDGVGEAGVEAAPDGVGSDADVDEADENTSGDRPEPTASEGVDGVERGPEAARMRDGADPSREDETDVVAARVANPEGVGHE